MTDSPSNTWTISFRKKYVSYSETLHTLKGPIMSDAMRRCHEMALALQEANKTEGGEKKELMDKFWNLASEGIATLELGKQFVPEDANHVAEMIRNIEL